MAVYVAAAPAGPGFVRRSYCFTGRTAVIFGTFIVLTDTILGAVVGGVAALLLSAIGEFPGGVFVAIAGGLLGAAVGLTVVRMGGCACPPGSRGFCLDFFFFVPVAFGPLIPLPLQPTPAPGSCILVPPGCP